MSQTTPSQPPVAQIAHRRHSAGDQRQFPRAVRFLPVRLLCPGHRQGVLSRPERHRGAAQCLRRVLARRVDAPGRRRHPGCLYRPHRPPPGPDRHAGADGARYRGDRLLPVLRGDRRRRADHRAVGPADPGLLRRRRAWRRLGLSLRNRDARQSRLLHFVPVFQPAGRDLRRGDHRLRAEREHSAATPSWMSRAASPNGVSRSSSAASSSR